MKWSFIISYLDGIYLDTIIDSIRNQSSLTKRKFEIILVGQINKFLAKNKSKVNSMNSGGTGPQGRRSCQPSMALASVARYAMMSIVPTLLVAVVTFIAIMSSAGPPATGAGLGCGAVSRFVCVHCTSTGKLSSRGLFLARSAVRRHMSRGRPWLSGSTC